LKIVGETVRILDSNHLRTVDGAALPESAACGNGSHSGCQDCTTPSLATIVGIG
jgi:hypothetical protein